MQIKITNIIAVSELEWYNSKVEELKKLPLKTQWTIRKNMKVLEPISQEFMIFRQELEEKKTSEWFVEGNGKCEKKTDDEGNEMLQILDEYMDEFLKYNNDLNKQINEIAFEEVEVEIEEINLEDIVNYVDGKDIELNMDDIDMLSIFEKN